MHILHAEVISLMLTGAAAVLMAAIVILCLFDVTGLSADRQKKARREAGFSSTPQRPQKGGHTEQFVSI